MIKNYINIAWRNLVRNKGFAITNLLGLTIGITCVIFIFLWVNNEVGYDKQHRHYKNIYQVIAKRDFKNNVFIDKNNVAPLFRALETGNPQIKNSVMTSRLEQHQLNVGNVRIRKGGHYIGGRYFDMFDWKFIKGSAATATKDPSAIILTASTARALFGDADPINKVVKLDINELHTVSAVLADIPGNSSIQFDYIIPYDFTAADVKEAMTRWSGSSWFVYIQTVDNPNIAALDKYINGVMHSHDNDKISSYFTYAMNKWHLYSEFKDGKNVGGMIEYVRFSIVLGIIILLIACVNFMNLSTARSEKRAKEVGVRKTLGSAKAQLVIQFFAESTLLVIAAFICSVILVYLLVPSFNLLVGQQLVLDLSNPLFLSGALIIILFTGIVAGSYPALYLSSFNPVNVLKGNYVAGKGAVAPRKVLVVFQFVASILLISATVIVYQQIQHVKERDMGYKSDNLLMVQSTAGSDDNFVAIKDELMSSGLVSDISRSSAKITEISWRSGSPDWRGKPTTSDIIFSNIVVDFNYAKTLGVKMLAGRDFTGLPLDDSSLMLNKAAVDAMQLKQPIGTRLNYDNRNYTVTGVTDNVIMSSPFTPVEPMMMFSNHKSSDCLYVRLKSKADTRQAINLLQNIYKHYSPADVFEYQFADQEYGKKFITEELISRITNIFAGLAIFVCCIGLAGLASFTIERRFKEIGVRKVLGATVQHLLLLIATEFLKLVAIAFVTAVPITWWLMHNWLQKYTYHISLSIWVFLAVGILILLLTLIVVSVNTMKAALANPIKSLRTE